MLGVFGKGVVTFPASPVVYGPISAPIFVSLFSSLEQPAYSLTTNNNNTEKKDGAALIAQNVPNANRT